MFVVHNSTFCWHVWWDCLQYCTSTDSAVVWPLPLDSVQGLCAHYGHCIASNEQNTILLWVELGQSRFANWKTILKLPPPLSPPIVTQISSCRIISPSCHVSVLDLLCREWRNDKIVYFHKESLPVILRETSKTKYEIHILFSRLLILHSNLRTPSHSSGARSSMI